MDKIVVLSSATPTASGLEASLERVIYRSGLENISTYRSTPEFNVSSSGPSSSVSGSIWALADRSTSSGKGSLPNRLAIA